MNRLDVFLHVLLDLVLVEVLESSIVYHIVSCFFSAYTLLDNHFSAELAVSLGRLASNLDFFSADLIVAVCTLSLKSHRIQLLLVIAVDVEDVDD